MSGDRISTSLELVQPATVNNTIRMVLLSKERLADCTFVAGLFICTQEKTRLQKHRAYADKSMKILNESQ